MVGNENSGRPGGNPDLINVPKTGQKTKEGKLRMLVSTGNLLPYSKSKILNYFKHCNLCPLRPRTEKRRVGNKEKEFTFPSKCASYRPEGKCLVEQGEMIKKLDYYFKVGQEQDTVALQESLTYSILENAELSKSNEIMKSRQPGFYTKEFQELAIKNLDSLNKIRFGERLTTQNLNINVDATDALIEAYRKRKEAAKEKDVGSANYS